MADSKTYSNPFRELADRHGLAFTANGKLPPATYQVLPSDSSPARMIASGTLPGGIEGLVCEFTSIEGKPATQDTPAKEPVKATLVMTRVPEAMAMWPMLGCHDLDEQRLTIRVVIKALMRQVEFESIKLNKRYRISVSGDQNENVLRQLFNPVFIDELAERAPDGFFFELHRGILLVATGGEPGDVDEVESVCKLAAYVAERVRSESLESAGRSEFAGNAATMMEMVVKDEKLDEVRFDQPPPDVASAAARFHEGTSRWKKMVPIVSGASKLRSTSRGFEAFIRGYAASRGLQLVLGSKFAVDHMRAPLPGVPGRAVGGHLPGGLDGWLAVANDPSKAGEHWDALPCVVVPGEPATPTLTVNPALTGGARMLGTLAIDAAAETINPQADRSAAVVEDLPPALAEWLGDDGATGIDASPGAIVIWRPPSPLQEWSATELDEFCERAAIGVAALRA